MILVFLLNKNRVFCWGRIRMLESLTVLLNVEDVPAALAFYNESFGFEKEQEYAEGGVIRWVSLRMGQTRLMLNEHGERSNERRQSSGSHHDVVLYIGVRDLDEIWRQLDQKGRSPSPIGLEDYGLRQFGLKDLDGYEIAVTALPGNRAS
ncbi:MAG: hypothetical protein Ct9H300mP8_00840 [Gammaproteobacteria bacterium]|nr:MAG: hypothetical protein Ct9H300mP8_00840 [Gammaproteobacteria bacterium]